MDIFASIDVPAVGTTQPKPVADNQATQGAGQVFWHGLALRIWDFFREFAERPERKVPYY